MSRLYSIIEGQVNNILRIIMEGEQGQVDWDFWSQYITPKYLRVSISLFASIVYLTILSMVGIYLWNQGIATMAPGIVKPFGNKAVSQDKNQYFQLFITLFASILFF